MNGVPPDEDEVVGADVVLDRLRLVHHRITEAGGDLDEICIVAVTKAKPVDAVVAALGAGLIDLGENYAQELIAKDDELSVRRGERATESSTDHDQQAAQLPRWHMIGRLQSNKVRLLAGRVALWQSVDRLSLVEEVARRDPGAGILIQVDISGEQTKGGVAPGETVELVDAAREAGLDVRGLMGVAAAAGSAEVGAQMATLRRLCDRLDVTICSMGMSGDLEIAVKEGATMVRIGSDLFGARPSRR